MTRRETVAGLKVEKTLFDFIENEILRHHPKVKSAEFWSGFARLLEKFQPKNKALLAKREALQQELDAWNKNNKDTEQDVSAYQDFLQKIGYLLPEPADFTITTQNVDSEIAEQFGPQLVVPIGNSRYALNAANARWGSLYDALYGTDAIPETGELARGKEYNLKRGEKVIAFGRDFLDRTIPLAKGSHKDATHYAIVDGKLAVTLKDGEAEALADDNLFVGYQGSVANPTAILLKHHGLHFELLIDGASTIGKTDVAGVKDIILESAVTTIMDLEDSTAAVDGADKALVYHNWLGLLSGTLEAPVTKNGKTFTRKLHADKFYTAKDGSELKLKGRSLMFIRNVGHLMTTPAILNSADEEIYEGILDAVVTALVAPYDFEKKKERNSDKGSVYIVKPKMHGPEEAAFADELFAAVEDLTHLPRHTLKIGVMDEERRTSINLKACIEAVKDRIVFINTGFLDRTGDEIHTSMYYGAMVRKGDMKKEPWFNAYELNNVQVGLECGLAGKAQIGKGMWAMPDKMAAMLKEKIAQPKAGATTAWVPSPTAATLHALHYHDVDVRAAQEQILARGKQHYLTSILIIPRERNPHWSAAEIKQELDNNCQGILGYVVRWVEQGIGCSKVPDIHNVGLMEDRATCRISSQHIANWLLQKIVTAEEVDAALERMAKVVDEQNAGDPHYVPMSNRRATSNAYQAARELIFQGLKQPSGYTEPILHAWRLRQKGEKA